MMFGYLNSFIFLILLLFPLFNGVGFMPKVNLSLTLFQLFFAFLFAIKVRICPLGFWLELYLSMT